MWVLGFGIWVFALSACGKKGPPQTPFVLVPNAPTVQMPRRVGSDVYVPVTVPAANLDGSKPAAVSRIELYAATAMTPPPRARFLDIATLVATVPVAAAGEPGDAVVPAPDPSTGALQGSTVTIRDALAGDQLIPREIPLPPDERARAVPAPAVPAAPANVLRRFYMAFAYSARNRPGPPSALAELPVTVLPVSPGDLRLAMTETTVTVEWDPSAGLVAWLFDRPLRDETAPPPLDVSTTAAAPSATLSTPPVDWLPGPTRYNVYRDMSPDPMALRGDAETTRPWQATLQAPINPAPLATLRFDDPIVFDDRERCYEIRAVRGGVESAPSPRRCVRAIDTYPPVVPTGLTAITAGGAVNLIWDPNVEEDLGGYLVLRREAGGDTLLQLTPAPIPETRFSDRTVQPGVRYTYEVRAVDRRVPVPNMSDAADVTETAR